MTRQAFARMPLREEYAQAHRRAMRALERKDLDGQREALFEERQIIAEQMEFIAFMKAMIVQSDGHG